ncbi:MULTISPECIES: YjjG family noncanonical pyrimidine nucleotidase [unclassified Tenacibaculum]|uniref:YjjG family noncanonical pyrimidine nucleotidase n=1 Tax=unclassified Tenacibaculum TaxID=2635139 RepID=UPI001F42BDFD|nr:MULTISPECIES: YjjG family noncanonical pyrimidine nucleotidase [unclassified Tenacibaculum]MCF2873306.1 YjjG family noncanonical pyrimidine nucleotidase [Tenacibaculum sp. Cn5-1]MCF2933462.1 YjjG family noncanonical pyrimidine nucleotidase [Tenacibaculum sp. Cn5-34]MCG7509957.1 YjjG family noncanonical pyrimidine nucleotidase [Tenacibaculum sp. Cn5-46]
MDIKHIFFDLDHTLWDFDRNSKLTFEQIFKEQSIKIQIDDFLEVYMPINLKYWRLFRENKILKKDLRYKRLKEAFDILKYDASDDLIDKISEDYIKYLPNNNYLFDGAFEILDYLVQKYELHIITNGFEEVQNVKLKKSGIDKYFKKVITSECIGVKKPNPKIFEYALKQANATVNNSMMIGDSYEADIEGAVNVGMSAIHFVTEPNINKTVTSINSLAQLKQYL